MERHSSPDTQDILEKAILFMKQVGLRSEAYLKGDIWVRSKLTDLKIDLWLATEQGEAEGSAQVEWLYRQIDTYEKVLYKTIFDPDPADLSGSLAIQAAAADLGQFMLQLAKINDTTHEATLSKAIQMLEEEGARDIAFECMERVSAYCGIVHEDVAEIIGRAKHLLSCCK